MAGPGGVEVGRASVRVLPDTTKFRGALQKYLDRTEKQQKPLKLRLGIDSAAFQTTLKGAVDAAESTLKDVQVGMDVDSASLASGVRGAVTAAESAVGQLDIPMDVDASSLAAKVRKAMGSAQDAVKNLNVELNLNVGRFIAAAHATVKAASTGLRAHVKLVLDTKGFAAALAVATTAANFFGASMLSSIASLPQFIGMLGMATVAAAGLAAPLAAAASAAVGAIAPMAALGVAMAPAAIGAAAMAVGTLKMAFNGMGDAMSAESAEDFNAAIQDMAPAAQEAAVSLRGLKEQFSGIGQEVQGTFFANISNLGDLSSLVEPLRMTMTGLASDMGNATAGLVSFVSQGSGLSAVQTLLHHSGAAASDLSYAFADVLKGITSVGAAAAPMFAAMTAGWAESAAGWAESMNAGFQDGSLQTYFQEAVTSAQQLWGVLSQLGSIVSGVFGAMSAAGQPFLGTMGQAITATEQWVNSAQGMATMEGFFTAMSTAVAAILPIFGQLANIIGTVVAPALAGLVTQIAPAISTLVTGLGEGLAGIAPSLAPLGAAFSAIATAIAPILPVLGQLIGQVVTALSPALASLAPLIEVIAGVFATLAPVVGRIAEILGGVLTMALQALTPWWDVLGQAIAMLAPYLMQVAEIFGGLLVSALQMITPLIPVIAAAFMQILAAVIPLLPTIMSLAQTLISALLPVLASLIPAFAAVIGVVANVISALAPIIAIVLQVAAAFIGLLGTILGFVASALGAIISFVAGVIGGFVGMVSTVVATVSGWVSSILGFVNELVQSFLQKANELWTNVVTAFSDGVSRALQFVADMPGKAKAALGNVGTILLDSGKALIQGFIDGIKNMIGNVKDAAGSVVQAARDFFPFSPAKTGPFSGKGWVLYSGRSLGSAFADGIADTTPDAAKATRGLMGAAAGNLKGYKSGVTAAGSSRLARSMSSGGAGVDTSVHIGQLVAADMSAPLREVRTMQLRAQIKAGQA